MPAAAPAAARPSRREPGDDKGGPRDAARPRHASLIVVTAVSLAALPALAADPPPTADAPWSRSPRSAARPLAVISWIPGSIVSRSDARIASVIAGRVTWIAEVGTRVQAGRPARAPRRHDAAAAPRGSARPGGARPRPARRGQLAARALQPPGRHPGLEREPAGRCPRAARGGSSDDVARADAQLRQAQYEIDQSVIRAPFPGVVTERFIQRGEYLQVGAATVRLVNTADIEARATASLELAANVHAGQVRERARSRRRDGTAPCAPSCRSGDDRSRQFEVRVTLAGLPVAGRHAGRGEPAVHRRAHRRHRAARCARHPPEPLLRAARDARQHGRGARRRRPGSARRTASRCADRSPRATAWWCAAPSASRPVRP